MISEKQLAANRRNARRSTGPQTEAGRRAASLNALKHGLAARATLLPGGDPAAYKALLDGFIEEFNPQTASDLIQVRKLADCEWRLRRIVTYETAMLAAAIEKARTNEPACDPVGAAFRTMMAEPGQSPPPEPTQPADLLLLGRRLLDGDINRFTALARYESSLDRQFSSAIRSLESRACEPTTDGDSERSLDQQPTPTTSPEDLQATETTEPEQPIEVPDKTNPFSETANTSEECVESFPLPPTDYRGYLKWMRSHGGKSKEVADQAVDEAA